MTTGELIADCALTVDLLRREGLTARQLWHLLTGQWREDVTWDGVEDYMVGWMKGRYSPLRRAA